MQFKSHLQCWIIFPGQFYQISSGTTNIYTNYYLFFSNTCCYNISTNSSERVFRCRLILMKNLVGICDVGPTSIRNYHLQSNARRRANVFLPTISQLFFANTVAVCTTLARRCRADRDRTDGSRRHPDVRLLSGILYVINTLL